MTEFQTIHPLGDVPPQSVESGDTSGITLNVRHEISMVQIFARNGREMELAKKLNIEGVPGRASETRSFTAFPLAPGQWMLVSKNAPGSGFGTGIAKKLKGIGYVSEQSDSRVCIRVSGSQARELLARGCRLDLHQSVASKGFCAQTPMAQVGVLLHQVNDGPTYDLYVYSGFARSFWEWLAHTAGQFGYSRGGRGH